MAATVDKLDEFKRMAIAYGGHFKEAPPLPSSPFATSPTTPTDPSSSGKPKKKKKKRKSSLLSFFTSSKPIDDPCRMRAFYEGRRKVLISVALINEQCEILEKTFQSIFMATGEQEILNHENCIQNCMKVIAQQVVQVKAELQKMKHDTMTAQKLVSPGSTDLRMRSVNQIALNQKFVQAIRHYHDVEVQAMAKQREKIKRQYLMEADLRRISDATGAMTLTQQQLSAVFYKENAEAALKSMKSKRRDIMQIEKSIVDLNRMFIELSEMVYCYDQELENLAQHLDNAVAYTEEAREHARLAVESQRNIRKLIGSRLKDETMHVFSQSEDSTASIQPITLLQVRMLTGS